MLENFTTWEILASYAGAVAMTTLVVQSIKRQVDKRVHIHTETLSYIVAVLILVVSSYFLGSLNVSTACLALFNAFIVSSTSNKTFERVKKAFETEK